MTTARMASSGTERLRRMSWIWSLSRVLAAEASRKVRSTRVAALTRRERDRRMWSWDPVASRCAMSDAGPICRGG